MSNATNWLETALGNWMFRGASAPTPPAGGFYVALHTADPTDSGAVGELVTATDINYTRINIPVASWAVGVDGRFATNTSVQFAAAGSVWGLIVGISLWDASTGGNAWAQYPLPTLLQRTISTGEIFRVSAGNLAVSIL